MWRGTQRGLKSIVVAFECGGLNGAEPPIPPLSLTSTLERQIPVGRRGIHRRLRFQIEIHPVLVVGGIDLDLEHL